jgi:hypothetical protein
MLSARSGRDRSAIDHWVQTRSNPAAAGRESGRRHAEVKFDTRAVELKP